MPVRDIEREMEALAVLCRSEQGEARIRALRKALKDRVNAMVAKAAKLTGDLRRTELMPDLCAAFERLLTNGAKTDPQCLAKEALAKALNHLGHNESTIFLKGANYVQVEPTWGGEMDSASNVRATCRLALLQCSDLLHEEKLWLVMPLMTERSPSLRKDAAFALENLEGRGAALLLRIKARMGDQDMTVVGQVFESLLRVEGEGAVPFVLEFLRDVPRDLSNEVREEAALALGASRLGAAVNALKEAVGGRYPVIAREVLLRALAISRQEEAIDFMLALVRKGRADEAVEALESLGLFRDSTDVVERISQAVARRTEPEIKRTFEAVFQPG